ncbi:MAG: DUF898 family protein [Bacteroidota bacterium]
MKKYFSFQLQGEEIFKYILLMLILVIVPALLYLDATGWNQSIPLQTSQALWFGLLFLFVFFGGLAISFFFYKLSIENIEYDSIKPVFKGKLSEFLVIVLKGIFFTIITIGIYLPWFIKDLYGFFIDETSYQDSKFKFQANGTDLLVIFILAALIPLGILALLLKNYFEVDHTFSFSKYFVNILETIAIAPFTFFYIRWIINIHYRNFDIKLDTDYMEGIGVILLQTFLAALTIGIYYPLAYLKIYQYFLQNTEVKNDIGENLTLGYELDAVEDFLFIWGQTLLSIITIGIYIPWAYCKVMKRVLGKTYIEK